MVRDRNECTLGVVVNGDEIEVKKISQAYRDLIFNYSSVFNIRLFSEFNGNGKYRIHISQPNRKTGNIQDGMSFDYWTIDNADIWYNWNDIDVYATIFDEIGNMHRFEVCHYKRPFNDQSLDVFPEKTVKRIVSCVKEIDKTYPDVESFKAVSSFLMSKKSLSWIVDCAYYSKMPIGEYIKRIDEYSERLKKVQSSYENAKKLLQSYSDEKAKQLLLKLEEEIEMITNNQTIRIYRR